VLKNHFASLLLFLTACFTHRAQAQAVVIPVVFHVVYSVAAENVHDSVLQHQLDVWNEDYNAQNADLWKVPGAWQPIIGDLDVQFSMASTDPMGNPSTGVERRQCPNPTWPVNDNVKYYSLGGLDAWPSQDYLNVWVCDLVSKPMGIAQFPCGPDSLDGIIMDYKYIGRGNYLLSPANLGRAATHVLGHWFGLHSLVDNPGCTDNDLVADTPPFANNTVYGGFATGTVLTDFCNASPPGIMWMNFMTNVFDSSMYFFTQGQVNRMLSSLQNCHPNFLNKTGTHEQKNSVAAIEVFPNPSTDGQVTLTRSFTFSSAEAQVYDMRGALVRTAIRFEEGEKNKTIDLAQLPPGLYTIVLRDRGSFASARVVIAR